MIEVAREGRTKQSTESHEVFRARSGGRIMFQIHNLYLETQTEITSVTGSIRGPHVLGGRVR